MSLFHRLAAVTFLCARLEDECSGSPAVSLPPQSSRGGLNGVDDVVVPLNGGHANHRGKVLGAVAGNGEDELGYSLLATPGVYNPGAIWFFFLSSPSRCTCSSLESDVVVLLLLVEGPVIVTGGKQCGDQACFYF